MIQISRKLWLDTMKKHLSRSDVRHTRRNVPQLEPLEDRTVPASLTGMVFADLNADGILDVGEMGVGGVTLILRSGDGNVVGTTVTGATGSYAFDVAAGKYSLQEVQPTGLGSTTPNVISIDLPDTGLSGQNFGDRFSSLAGRVYFDANNNGVQDAGEPALAGVKLQLTGTDANGLAINQTQFSKADGSYLFDNLLSGTYTITETTPDKFNDGLDAVGTAGGTIGNDVITNIPLTAGVAGTGYNFGERGTAITGVVFLDTDRDGQFDTTEKGIAGVLISLRNDKGEVVATTVTGENGGYLFNGLTAGRFTITETQPTGYGNSTANVRSNVDVTANGLTGQNFGETLGALGGFVYIDANNNGKFDTTEKGIAGAKVTLTGTDVFGTAVNQTATSGADGSYNFTELFSGTYVVTETQPSPFIDGKDTVGTVNGILRGKLGADTITNITLPDGRLGINYNFGEKAPTATGTTFITGSVFFDKNGNGKQDADETGIADVTLTLKDENSVVVGTTKTDSSGFYGFFDIKAGKFTIEETQPDGFDSSSLDTLLVTVPAEGLIGQNFAEVTSSISGQVYLDLNNNGFRDANEQGLGGVLITLTGTETTSGKAVTRTTTTGVDGKYSFANLRAGTYVVEETQPIGVADGQDRTGTGGGTLANDKVSNISLGIGASVTGYDFGEVNRGMSGVVFVDLNNNGLQDAGEPGIAGVQINLTGTDSGGNAVTRIAFTSATGFFSFNDLPVGTYELTQTQPGGWTDGQDRVGTLGGTLANDKISNIIVTAGSFGTGYLFGEQGTVLTGRVFIDSDRDSIEDPTEAHLGGVLLTLRGPENELIGTTLTAADGSYMFGPLVAGDYTLEMTLPNGYGTLNGANNGPHDLIHEITVPAGSVTSELFAVTTGSLSGSVYRDFNNNGLQDVEETGIAGVLLTLTGTDANGVSVSRQVVTGTDGTYSFSGLLGGTYAIAQTQPAGFYDGQDSAGTINGNPAGTVGADTITDITLAAGLDGINFRFGEMPSAALNGYVFIDADNDGVMDPATTVNNKAIPAEQGIGGVTITISGTRFDGKALTAVDVVGGLTRVTGADGFYEFGQLPPGVYSVRETQPAGFADGNEQMGDDFDATLPTNDRVVVADDFFSNVRLDPQGNGQLRGPFSFGELQPSSLSGVTYVDRNNNGIRDAGERALRNVLVRLRGTDDRGNVINLTVRSDANGQFTIENLRPSNATGYTLDWVAPFGFVKGRARAGTGGGTLAPNGGRGPITQIVLGVGIQAVDYELGHLIPGKYRLVR